MNLINYKIGNAFNRSTANSNCFFLRMTMLLLSVCICSSSIAQQYAATINTAALSSNPNLSQYVSSNNVTVTITAPGQNANYIQAYGKIERLSPSPFTITTGTNYRSVDYLFPRPGVPLTLTSAQKTTAFGNFTANNLVATGINLASLRDANNNIILPDGSYRICYYAKTSDYTPASDPNLGCATFTIACEPINGVLISTIAKLPFNPIISQAIATGGVTTSMQFKNQTGCNVAVKLFGKIERISPSPFTITVNANYIPKQPLNPAISTPLTTSQLADAFGNFAESNLSVTGIDLASIKDARNNIVLPDGTYRICVYARYVSGNTLGNNASNPNLGCGTFSICSKAGIAPQFTQPVNNLNINSLLSIVNPAATVIFTWTPPQSTCGLPAGGFTYDFEIREIFNNQTVTDALNNAYIFRKTGLPSTTFLLDTNLNRNVLQQGKKYAVRIRAISTNLNQPVEIENNGYSRVEGFQYGNSAPATTPKFNVAYIPFIERRSNFWDDKLTDYENHKAGDTLVPLKQYVPLVLAKNNIVYSPDAIELFLVLNPELTEMDKVKLSYAPKLPDLAAVPIKDARTFITEHSMNLTPDVVEENRFEKYLDSLNLYVRTQKTNVQGSELVELVKHLNTFSRQVRTTDRVTMNLINTLLSELLFELRSNLALLNRRDFNQLKSVIANIEDLLTSSSEVTSFLNRYEDQLLSYNKTKHPAGYSNADAENTDYLPALMDPLLPFNVILCRYTKTLPSTPILTTPDLMGTYKVYYVLSTLYNHKNPEINAKSTNTPASTAQVSLPKTTFKLWAENILNRTKTKEQDIDFMDAFLRSKKRWPYPKHFTIIIKAE